MRLIIAIAALLIVLPKIGLQCLVALYRQKRIALWESEYAGKDLTKITHRTILIDTQALADVDQWLHYLKGNIDLTGPRALDFGEAQKMSQQDKARFNIAPGIISPFQVKKASGIAHASEQAVSYTHLTLPTTRRV